MNVFCQVTNGSLIYSQIIDYFTTVVTSAPTGSACGIVLYYMRAPVFPRAYVYRIHLVVRAILLTLKLLEFLRCDVPVSSTLAWWQRWDYPRLREPENRLADPSNDESSYPVVD